jgi:hypothetical protein
MVPDIFPKYYCLDSAFSERGSRWIEAKTKLPSIMTALVPVVSKIEKVTRKWQVKQVKKYAGLI